MIIVELVRYASQLFLLPRNSLSDKTFKDCYAISKRTNQEYTTLKTSKFYNAIAGSEKNNEEKILEFENSLTELYKIFKQKEDINFILKTFEFINPFVIVLFLGRSLVFYLALARFIVFPLLPDAIKENIYLLNNLGLYNNSLVVFIFNYSIAAYILISIALILVHTIIILGRNSIESKDRTIQLIKFGSVSDYYIDGDNNQLNSKNTSKEIDSAEEMADIMNNIKSRKVESNSEN